MIVLFLSLSRHMPGSLFGNALHELLACRLTAFNFLNNIVASFWNIMKKRLMERTKTDYCHWITQGAWMYCTLEIKWETSSWTEGSSNILMNSFVIRKLDFNLFGDLLFCCFPAKQWRTWHKGPNTDPDALGFSADSYRRSIQRWTETILASYPSQSFLQCDFSINFACLLALSSHMPKIPKSLKL